MAIVLALLVPSVADATPRPDYPSWQDVQNAKRSESAKRNEIAKLQAILAELEAQAQALGTIALQRGEEYAQAQDALDAAVARSQHLDEQADAAQDRAETSSLRASQYVSQLARSGGGDLTMSLMFGSSSETDDLLARIGTIDRLGAASNDIVERAVFDRNAVASLAEQAEVAEAERQRLAKAAEEAWKTAQQAAADAEAQVAEQKRASAQLYAQLASLKNTTASVEEQYQAGLEWEAAQNAVTTPPTAPVVNPTPPAPVGSAVEGAISFAKAQLGDAYLLGGMGPDAWDCSGLTKAAYAYVGVYIGTHSASNQYNTMASANRLVNINQLQAGDLLFYSTGGSTSASKYHTTLYLGGGLMIEAPRPGVAVRIVPIRYGDLVPYAGRPTG
jgi:cell wall-associated NlpC family hydrolase